MIYTDEHCDNISNALKDKLDNNEKWGFHIKRIGAMANT